MRSTAAACGLLVCALATPALSGSGADESGAPIQGLDAADEELLRRFYWLLARRTPGMQENRWLGIRTRQHPFDVWITQEIMAEAVPDIVLETGTDRGGSAILWATILQHLNHDGRVITIDIQDKRALKAKTMPIARRRVDFLLGSSTAPEIVAEVRRRAEGKKVLVILDSLHTKDHVLAELQAYSSLVPVGGYVIVQDSTVNGHPYDPDFGPGPWEAIDAFLERDDRFVADRSRERWLLTNNPRGFLKRVR